MRVRAAFVSLAVATSACGEVEEHAPSRAGVYAEFTPFDALVAHLPVLAEARAALHVAVPAEHAQDPALGTLLRAAEARRVEVRVWPVLAREDGYWPGETNVARFDAAVDALLGRLDAERLVASTVVFDLEPDLAYTEALRAAWPSGLDAVGALMREHHDTTAFATAREALAATVARVQARGMRAECVTYPQVLDDLADGDDDLQDVLDVPVRGIAWAEVAFMVYQTTFAEAADTWLGPGLVASYAASARAHFGDRGTIALGVVGSAGVAIGDGPAYADPATLAADVAAARAAGVERVEVYSLDGMAADTAGPRSWLRALAAGPHAAPPRLEVDLVRAAAAGLDGQLD
jgi:hypothetical protein